MIDNHDLIPRSGYGPVDFNDDICAARVVRRYAKFRDIGGLEVRHRKAVHRPEADTEIRRVIQILELVVGLSQVAEVAHMRTAAARWISARMLPSFRMSIVLICWRSDFAS